MNINKAIKSAFKHYQSGDFQQAEHICKKILLKKPNTIEAVHLLASVSYRLCHYDLAMKYFMKAVQLNPNLADAHCSLGFILQEKGRLDEAMIHAKKALEINSLSHPFFNKFNDTLKNKQML